jgi:hypothetical protein
MWLLDAVEEEVQGRDADDANQFGNDPFASEIIENGSLVNEGQRCPSSQRARM